MRPHDARPGPPVTRALAALALALALAAPTRAAEVCAVDPALLESPHPLPGVAAALAAGAPLHVVALGSSSTEGVGATAPDRTYPARLAVELARLFPRSTITVDNRGVSGQTATDMLARLDDDVVAQRPDLVVWQTGTNSALESRSVGEFHEDVVAGIRRMRAAGAEVIVMGPQKSPRLDVAVYRPEFVAHLQAAAEVTRAPYFPRYEIMAGWLASGGMTPAEMIDPDGLHMTDLSYGCLAEAVARMIAGLARAPVARR
jgi:lysophospholipase L1-like esterase